MNNVFDIDSPVILTGRGGSGTRLLSELLQDIPVFIGSRINASGDALDWVQLSREILFADATLENGGFTRELASRFHRQAEEFLSRAPKKTYQGWGWKLPEMIFSIPEMIYTFPGAKIIHLVRHPVSLCLRRTHISSRMDNKVGQTVLPRAYKSLGLDVASISGREEYFNNAVSWQYQVNRLIEFADTNLGKDQYLMVKYEDIISDLEGVMGEICAFLGTDIRKPPELGIDHQRTNQCFDISHTQQIQNIWSICGPTAESAGYEKITLT